MERPGLVFSKRHLIFFPPLVWLEPAGEKREVKTLSCIKRGCISVCVCVLICLDASRVVFRNWQERSNENDYFIIQETPWVWGFKLEILYFYMITVKMAGCFFVVVRIPWVCRLGDKWVTGVKGSPEQRWKILCRTVRQIIYRLAVYQTLTRTLLFKTISFFF